MPFVIDDKPLDSRLDELAKAQPVRASRTQLAVAILREACTAFEATGNAEVWRIAQQVPPTGQRDNGASASVHADTTSHDPSVDQTEMSQRPNAGKTAPKRDSA